MAKPHIVRGECRLAPHGISAPWMLDLDLLLVHLKFSDMGELQRRNELRNSYFEKELGGNPGWASNPADLQEYARRLVRLPPAGVGLPHRDWMNHYFGNAEGKLIGEEGGPDCPQTSNPSIIALHDYLEPALRWDRIRAHRHELPLIFRNV